MNTEPSISPTTRHSLQSKVRALSVILAEEFGVAFTFHDAASGLEVPLAKAEAAPGSCHAGATVLVGQAAAEGQCRTGRLDDAHNLLALVIFQGDQPQFVATAVQHSLAGVGPERSRELDHLRKWLQTFSDRLRLNELVALTRSAAEEQAVQFKRAWDTILGLDESIRHMRIHRDVETNRRNILRKARGYLEAQTVLWVPQQPPGPSLVEGEPCLAPADCRHLADLVSRRAVADSQKHLVWNADSSAIWSQRFPQIRNVIAFRVSDHDCTGWLLAINKQGQAQGQPAKGAAGAEDCPFRGTDAAVFAPFAALFQLQLRASRRYQDLKSLLVGLTRSLTAALDAKDPSTFGHSERVARIAMQLGEELGLQTDELSDIYLGGLLHDIGKIGIPDAILCKTGILDAEEMEQMKQHVTIGYQILADLQPLRGLLPGVLYHHERVDGKGYPEGLAGENIPLLARILAVADAYDAMSNRRSYRHSLSPDAVENTLKRGAGSQWDARVVEAFFRCRDRIDLIRQRGIGQSLGQALETAMRAGTTSRATELQATH